MQIRDWIDGFRDRHRSRFPRDDWPDGYRDGWLDSLVLVHATEAEADAASVAMARGEPPRFAHDHVHELIVRIESARQATPPSPEADRDAAAAASRDCPYCSGAGLCTIYHRDYDGNPTITVGEKDAVARYAAHCVCDLGRWMRGHTEPEMLKRIPDLRRTLDGAVPWTWRDPTVPDGAEVDGATWRERAEWVRAMKESVVTRVSS
ncbi:unnamed protein product [uncultured bacterium]|nr:unnamed protein product [uncultured bacterium]